MNGTLLPEKSTRYEQAAQQRASRRPTPKGFKAVDVPKIENERDFYKAISEYTEKTCSWQSWYEDDYIREATPDEMIELLQSRVEWLKAHKRAVDRYLRKQAGPHWVRVYENPKVESG